jgi:hypothetical protein
LRFDCNRKAELLGILWNCFEFASSESVVKDRKMDRIAERVSQAPGRAAVRWENGPVASPASC